MNDEVRDEFCKEGRIMLNGDWNVITERRHDVAIESVC
jgi:hypothetical protein